MPYKLLITCFLAVSIWSSSVVAEEIPMLDLKTMQGSPEDLDHWVGKGKWVLVMFWKLHCQYCDMNKPAITEFYNKHKDKDALVIGVSIDGMDKLSAIKQKIKQMPLGFPNYIAELPIMAMNYQIAAGESFRGTPTYWFFSPEGELKAVNPGPVRMEALEAYMARFATR